MTIDAPLAAERRLAAAERLLQVIVDAPGSDPLLGDLLDEYRRRGAALDRCETRLDTARSSLASLGAGVILRTRQLCEALGISPDSSWSTAIETVTQMREDAARFRAALTGDNPNAA